jgi:YbbR domain-containing protein
VDRRGVEIVEVSPAFVSVTLETSTSKQVQVQANLIGTPAQGFSVTSVETTPTTVRVSGAASLVQLASTAVADVNLTGLRVNLQQQYSLTPRDARGVDLRGLTLEPSNADVKVAISQQEVTLGLTVVPQVQGVPAEGYNLVAATSDPPAIAVTGPIELLNSLSFVTTEAVDASGLRADAVRTVRLRLPAGLNATRDSVSVRLRVVPAPGEMQMPVAPQVTNVPENLRATLQTTSITVRLSGEAPTLRTLTAGSVRATVSAAGLDEGVHVLRPLITVPDGVQLVSSDPAQVVVVLTRR